MERGEMGGGDDGEWAKESGIKQEDKCICRRWGNGLGGLVGYALLCSV